MDMSAYEIRNRQAEARGAARAAFLATGKPSLSIRKREVLPRDDLDERLDAALTAYMKALDRVPAV